MTTEVLHGLDPVAERLLEESRERGRGRLRGGERTVRWLWAVAFLAVAAALAATTPPSAHIDIFLLAALLLSFAVASRIEFEVGSGFAVPTELVLVPMLFLLPAEIVPLVVAAALVLGQAPDYILGRAPLERVAVPIGNASFALGPAAVIAAVGVPGPARPDGGFCSPPL